MQATQNHSMSATANRVHSTQHIIARILLTVLEELARLKDELLRTQSPYKDPEKIIKEAIQQTREAVGSAVTSQQTIQKQYEQAQKEANESCKKAQIALQEDNENLAFNALIAKKVQGKIATAIKTQLQQQEATVKLLNSNLTALENVKLMLEIEAELADMKTQLINSTTP